tara:strand:+ start:116432 stop:116653 length:222 start_codon:yes stop_codon:yes gene_type:complete
MFNCIIKFAIFVHMIILKIQIKSKMRRQSPKIRNLKMSLICNINNCACFLQKTAFFVFKKSNFLSEIKTKPLC